MSLEHSVSVIITAFSTGPASKSAPVYMIIKREERTCSGVFPFFLRAYFCSHIATLVAVKKGIRAVMVSDFTAQLSRPSKFTITILCKYIYSINKKNANNRIHL